MRREGWQVQFGWRGLIRSVVLTAMITSAGWVLAGVWWLERHPQPPLANPAGPVRQAGSPATAQVLPMRSPVGPAAITGHAPAPGSLTIPVSGVRAADLLNTFDQARAAGARRHDAIDIMAPTGTPVVAVADGLIEKLFQSREGGNTVYQRSRDGRTIYYYAHLHAYAPGLAEGQPVSRGTPIGQVGYSGNANPAAPHLHFAVMQTSPQARWHDDARAVNPYPLLGGRGMAVPPAVRATPGP